MQNPTFGGVLMNFGSALESSCARQQTNQWHVWMSLDQQIPWGQHSRIFVPQELVWLAATSTLHARRAIAFTNAPSVRVGHACGSTARATWRTGARVEPSSLTGAPIASSRRAACALIPRPSRCARYAPTTLSPRFPPPSPLSHWPLWCTCEAVLHPVPPSSSHSSSSLVPCNLRCACCCSGGGVSEEGFPNSPFANLLWCVFR